MTDAASYRSSRHERDYIERTIAMVRNHQHADNCWPQWANIFADEIERLWDEVERYESARQEDAIRLDQAQVRIDRQTQHIADLREGCYEEGVQAKRAERALGEIEGKARWYADNLQRDPQEVDHALCVEILDLAQRALEAEGQGV